MEKVTMYKCGYCGSTFNTDTECKRCEEHHMDIYKIEGNAQYLPSSIYPLTVFVTFSNGVRREYHRGN